MHRLVGEGAEDFERVALVEREVGVLQVDHFVCLIGVGSTGSRSQKASPRCSWRAA